MAHLPVKHTRIPDYILNKRTLQIHGMDAADGIRLMPDALIIEALPQETGQKLQGRLGKCSADGHMVKVDRIIYDPKADPPHRPRKAYVIEVGYGSETKYKDKLEEKYDQHKHWQSS
ncbi:hypothetical protein MMC29_000001 [Sticta canariensis]|nr:hypothetical protein [Sticta canariensis]